MNFLFVQYVEL
jgi:hypothetical protein